MDRPNDPFWNDVEDMNDGSMKCKFCGDKFASDTSISRIKWHLSGERGHGVSICGQVPKEVQEAAFLAIRGGNKRHKSIPSSSNVNDYAISTFPQEQDNAGDAGRMQVGVQGMENTGEGSFQHVDRSVSPSRLGVDAHESTGEAAQGTDEWSYDVFLSFRGEDTRKTITDHLYSALIQAGIHPFLIRSNKPVGKAFEENRKVIWSLLMDDEVSTIGIYGMGGVGKTTILQHIHNELLERPDICDHVWWVIVSQDFSIKRLQNLIAKRLDLDLSSEDDDLHRAAKLSEELRKKQKWILILDDLWNSFELHEVGIHSSLKGCKLILTTRSQTVCAQIACQHKIEVKSLSEGEAWTLFKESLGHHITLSDELEEIAKAVARECAGLPLGIITVAGSLRGVDDPHQWRNTLKKLKDSGTGDMKVFKLLRFSYDRLGDSALQQCLLYCALFPEDHRIEREELIGYLIDEGIIKGMGRRQDAFDEGHTMLNKLQNVCLLESDETEDGRKCVKMHDLIRDMAIQIMLEMYQVIVKAEIPPSHSPMCPNLSTLFLRDNQKLRLIADSFFKEFRGLKVLDLSNTNIQKLPESISDLVSLTALLLTSCWMLRDVPSLKKLVALKRLDLYNTKLETMPQGMECLTNLSGVLPKLSRLQVLALDMNSITVKGKEVGSLRNLETLECNFEGLSDFVEYLRSRNGIRSLSTCKISSLFSSSWFCPAPLPSPSYNDIFSSLQEFYCYGCSNMKNLFPLVLLPNLANLKEIRVEKCAKLEEIIGATGSDEESREFNLPKGCQFVFHCLKMGSHLSPPSLERIHAYPKEWWERVVEWEHPNAKEVLRPIVYFS
ncbi:disease resistance protein [Salix suchowensis]|nr:disease resistance protein [Salix suchowensis]